MSLNAHHPIEDILAKDLFSLPMAELAPFIERAFQYWRERGFPYREMTDREIKRKFELVKNSSVLTMSPDKQISSSTSGLELANFFHPQIWKATRWGHHKSPIDYFNDDDTLRKLLEKTIRLWPDRRCWSAYVIRSVFRIYSGGRVSNFRPTVSKALIEKFSFQGATVLDFCAGFGGRLLGAMALERHYIGIDPSITQIDANKKMYETLRPFAKCSAEFLMGCAEEVMPTLKSASIDLIFTSPPYFKQEKYNKESNQSYLRYKNYEKWKNDFLHEVIIQSKRLLKPGGLFIINIADVRGYPLAADFEKLGRNHFSFVDRYELDMVARPLHRKTSLSNKSEPVYIFRKKIVDLNL
ncbi:DNA methyltransferase [Pedobacter jejuensis]|uniref:Methyltransferase n=1 Tax=Pedobacter jejuensis TaxID=1268550 RepID=A0A3N0BVX9_9SPHI|nr:DNA methyltransferase [Pedobacter jejuensis]RNL53143.1 hypothetical protein D7004_10580 [Pedobacter jejuensis]